MKETDKENIDEKLEELVKYLKIDTKEKHWRERINQDLKGANLSYKIYRALGVIIMVGAGLIMIIAFFFKGETIFGIAIKENYFHFFMIIVLVSSMFGMIGKIELKLDRLKTFLLLHDLEKE